MSFASWLLNLFTIYNAYAGLKDWARPIISLLQDPAAFQKKFPKLFEKFKDFYKYAFNQYKVMLVKGRPVIIKAELKPRGFKTYYKIRLFDLETGEMITAKTGPIGLDMLDGKVQQAIDNAIKEAIDKYIAYCQNNGLQMDGKTQVLAQAKSAGAPLQTEMAANGVSSEVLLEEQLVAALTAPPVAAALV